MQTDDQAQTHYFPSLGLAPCRQSAASRQSWYEIDLGAIRHNYHQLRAHLPRTVKIFACLKRNGYGCGAGHVARTLAVEGADGFAVATLPDARAIREMGIELPVLLYPGPLPASAKTIESLGVTVTVSSMDELERWRAAMSVTRIFVKADLGFFRAGTTPRQMGRLLAAARACSDVEVQGLYAHMSELPTSTPSAASEQFAPLQRILEEAEAVLLLGRQGNQTITQEQVAAQWGTDVVGLYAQLRDHIPRVYVWKIRRRNRGFGMNAFRTTTTTTMHAIPRHTVAAAAEAIQIEDLHKKFGALHVLKGVSLSARDGDVVAVIGGSGSGKSTLLRCINCLENPTSGVIRVNGEEIRLKPDGNGSTVPADRQQIERIRSRLGMVFQSFNLWSHMTLLENVIEVPVHVEADWNVRCHQGGRRPGFVSTPKTESHLARHFTSSKPTEYPKRPSYPSLAGIEHRDSHSRERTAAKHAWS